MSQDTASSTPEPLKRGDHVTIPLTGPITHFVLLSPGGLDARTACWLWVEFANAEKVTTPVTCMKCLSNGA